MTNAFQKYNIASYLQGNNFAINFIYANSKMQTSSK